jgi:hypothetical protein
VSNLPSAGLHAQSVRGHRLTSLTMGLAWPQLMVRMYLGIAHVRHNNRALVGLGSAARNPPHLAQRL